MSDQLETPFGNEFAYRHLVCAPPNFRVCYVLTLVHTADLLKAGLDTCIQFNTVRCSHDPRLSAIHEDKKHKCIVEVDLCKVSLKRQIEMSKSFIA